MQTVQTVHVAYNVVLLQKHVRFGLNNVLSVLDSSINLLINVSLLFQMHEEDKTQYCNKMENIMCSLRHLSAR